MSGRMWELQSMFDMSRGGLQSMAADMGHMFANGQFGLIPQVPPPPPPLPPSTLTSVIWSEEGGRVKSKVEYQVRGEAQKWRGGDSPKGGKRGRPSSHHARPCRLHRPSYLTWNPSSPLHPHSSWARSSVT